MSSPWVTSSDRSSSQHLITDRDDFSHTDSVQCPVTLSNEQTESAIVHASLEAVEINERMSSVPNPPYNRPRRVELTSDQNGGAPEMVEVDELVVYEAAATFCNGQSEELLLSQEVQTQHLARVCCLSLKFEF